MEEEFRSRFDSQITRIVDTKTSVFRRILVILILALFTAAGIFLIFEYRKGNFSNIQTFQDYVQSYGIFGPLFLGIFQCIKVVYAFIPGTLGYIAGPSIFGSWKGFICNYIGISAGSILAFTLSRKFGVKLVKQIFSPKRYDKCIKWMEKWHKSFPVFLWLALLIPVSPDDFLCYFAGLTDLSFRKFILVILTAKPWIIIFYSIVFGNIFN